MGEHEVAGTLEFEFYPHTEGYEDVDLRFGVNPDMNIWQLKRLCKRFAAAMGFAEGSIEEAFGEDTWDD